MGPGDHGPIGKDKILIIPDFSKTIFKLVFFCDEFDGAEIVNSEAFEGAMIQINFKATETQLVFPTRMV